MSLQADFFYSPLLKIQRFYVDDDQRDFDLEHNDIIINTAKVYDDSLEYISGQDYLIDYQLSKIHFFRSLGHVNLSYQIYPPNLYREYYLYRQQEYSDSASIAYPKHRRDLFSGDLKLNITGSKTIAVSVASDNDFGLDQSLFLRISGEISRNLKIEAQLSDSQSPVTPEGDSREISNLDQIFLRLYGSQYELAFGDLEMTLGSSRFLNYTPQFEGLKAGWFGRNTFKAALAISKGKRTISEFYGVEGKQGPYYLSFANSSGIQVVAGSESVFLNGIQLQRGEDYTIDYSEGSITFRNRHFITATSFIRVSYQYTDEEYRQNLYLAGSEIKISDYLNLSTSLIHQKDDRDNPLNFVFSKDDKNILRESGDSSAWGSGIFATEPGDGEYIYLENEDYYQYVGSDSTGNFNLVFSFVGSGEGDYQQVQEGDLIYYEYAGPGLGDYLPVRLLPKPTGLTNYDLHLRAGSEIFWISMEGLISDYDQNTFSDKDDSDNLGYAVHTEIGFRPELDRINPEIEIYYRILSADLTTFSDYKSALESYEVNQFAESLDRREYAATLNTDIWQQLKSQIHYRHSEAEDDSRQDYLTLSAFNRQKYLIPEFRYRFLTWKQNYTQMDFSVDSEISSIVHDLEASYQKGYFRAGNEIYLKKLETDLTGFAETGKYQKRFKYSLSLVNVRSLAASIYYEKEIADTLAAENDWLQESLSHTGGWQSLLSLRDHRFKLVFSHRQNQTDRIRKYNMAEVTIDNSFWKDAVNLRTSYNVSNLEFYPKIKEFQYIGDNLGSYDADTLYVGLFNGDYNWVVTSIDYDNPRLSVEVNTSMNLFFKPQNITHGFFRKIQTETYLMIVENSTESNKADVYLLNPQVLMDPETTLYGRRTFEQSIWYDLIYRRLTLKLNYESGKTLDNRYNEESNETNRITKTVSLRLYGMKKTSYELTYDQSREDDSRYQSSLKINSLSFQIRNMISTDLNLKTELDLSRENGSDQEFDRYYRLDSVEISEQITYYLASKYRFFGRLSYRRNQRKGSGFLSFLVDKKEGDIFKWNINFDYRVSTITTASLEYSGNSYPQKDQEHELRLELKAEF